MWTQVQKIIQLNPAAGNGATPPAVPLRKAQVALDSIALGMQVRFSVACPLKPLSGATASVIAVRHYRFGTDSMNSYQLLVGQSNTYFLTIASDDQGNYLSLSRALDWAEQASWFGLDALSFFTEASTAKSIRCKADLMLDGDWAAARYSKTVDWVEGTVANGESLRLARSFHYNLLVNESGEKALEIEHDDISGENRVFVTVYRPVDDISAVEPATVIAPVRALTTPPPATEAPLFREPALSSAQPKQRPDFRRLDEVGFPEIHIARTSPAMSAKVEPQPDLPSFLLAREDASISLDQVLPPEAERVRVNISAARALIERAISKNVRVRDVLRDMLSLQSALSDEMIFELPLSDEDYRTLAMRYKLRPDHRTEIRARLEEELRLKLTGVAKA